jgi:hypothetical protein
MKVLFLVLTLVLSLTSVANALSSDKCFASIDKSNEMSVYYGKDRQILKGLDRGTDRYNKQLINVNEDAHLVAAFINHAKKVCGKN